MSDISKEVKSAEFDSTQLTLWDESTPSVANMDTFDGVSLGLASLVGRYELDQSLLAEPDEDIVDSAGIESIEQDEYYDDIESFVDFDDYLTPSEKKQKAVSNWLKSVVSEYRDDLVASRQHQKKSKREKQQQLADRRFKRHFENYGTDNSHILYDADALDIVITQLKESNPKALEKVMESSVDYIKADPLNFATDPKAFASVIRNSTESHPNNEQFDEILEAVFNNYDFVHSASSAASLQIALAHTVFETTGESNIEFYQKIVDTAYLRNDIIKNKPAYATAIENTISAKAVETDFEELIADTLNARLVFGQVVRAFLDDWTEYNSVFRSFINKDAVEKYILTIKRVAQQRGLKTPKVSADEADYYANPLHYDPIELFDLSSGARIELPSDNKTLPDRWRDLIKSSELHKKRIAQLTPRALARDIIMSNFGKGIDEFKPSQISEVPISPGYTLTFIWTAKENNQLAGNYVLSRFMTEHAQTMDLTRLEPGENKLFGMAQQLISIPLDGESEDDKIMGYVIVRKSVPEDLKGYSKQSAMSLAFVDRVLGYVDRDKSREDIEAKKEHIKQNRHNYFGRRPVSFKMPPELRNRGLLKVEMRQHEDRRHVVVSTKHKDGDVEYLFDQDMNYADNNDHAISFSPLQLALEDFVVSLAAEWTCKEVVETSEGTVKSSDEKSKVNFGFLRYLPIKAMFSAKQRNIFAREQHGDLKVESQRRKPQDPKGLGRNSTYVKENYDPTKPPLEIHYDPEVLAQ